MRLTALAALAATCTLLAPALDAGLPINEEAALTGGPLGATSSSPSSSGCGACGFRSADGTLLAGLALLSLARRNRGASDSVAPPAPALGSVAVRLA